MMRVMSPAIPRRTREITAAWLDEVLKDAEIEAPKVRDLKVEQINLGTGFAGRVFRLRPQYEGDAGDAPRSMIAKLPSTDATTRALINEIRGYELESIFYRDLAERTPTPVPRCFWNAADTDTGDFMLILEDLEGYSVGGQTADEVDVDLVTALVREAARLHTTWWNDDASLARASLPDAEGPELRAWMRVAREGLPIWERTRGGQYPRKVVTQISAAMSDIERLAATAAEGATTLVHGDYRLDNVMYAPDNLERPLVVLDWQLVPGARVPTTSRIC